MDLDTHGMFICTVTEARVMSDKETMTYTYYQKNVKPNHRQKERKDLSVSFADTSTKEMSCRMTLSVRFANMEWRILSRYREKRSRRNSMSLS